MTLTDIGDPQLYAAMSEEELKAHIKKLQELLNLRQGHRPLLPPKEFLAQMFSSKDFCGTGMTMEEFVQAGYMRDFQSNLVNQGVEERRRRLDLIVELSIELVKVREQTHFATRIAEGVIENVINGDWWSVQDQARYFTFLGEDADLRERQGPIYAKFVVICQKAFDTRPKPEEVEEPDKN